MRQIILKVKHISTGEIVKTLGPMSERKAEKVTMGLLINMNRDEYCVVEEEEGER